MPGFLVQLVAQADGFQGLFGSFFPLRAPYPGQGEGQLHISQGGLVGDEVVALKHKAHRVIAVAVPIPVGEGFGGAAINEQITGGVLVKSAYNVEQGGFSAP